MHELSIAMSVLDFAAKEAERRRGESISAIYLRVGPLAGVVSEALQSAFNLARETSATPQAELVVEDVDLVAYCSTCAAERTLASPACLQCPVCGTPTPEIIRGRELEIVALEIESSI